MKKPTAAAQTTELYKTYRPRTLDEVHGQTAAVDLLKRFFKRGNLPHATLLTGPSGTGKTTLARIIARYLGIDIPDDDTERCMDYMEVDCGSLKEPLAEVRKIKHGARLSPAAGPYRVYYLDEVQALSRAKFAQQALLKVLEDPPKRAYFILATTEPNKVIATVRNRCTPIALKPLRPKDIMDLLVSVVTLEGQKGGFRGDVTEDVLDRIVGMADGSARKSLVLLESIADAASEEEMLAGLASADAEGDVVAFARLMMSPAPSRAAAAVALRTLEGIDADGLRRSLIGYWRAVALNSKFGGPSPRAMELVEEFRDNVFDSGHAGLAAMTYAALTVRRK